MKSEYLKDQNATKIIKFINRLKQFIFDNDDNVYFIKEEM